MLRKSDTCPTCPAPTNSSNWSPESPPRPGTEWGKKSITLCQRFLPNEHTHTYTYTLSCLSALDSTRHALTSQLKAERPRRCTVIHHMKRKLTHFLHAKGRMADPRYILIGLEIHPLPPLDRHCHSWADFPQLSRHRGTFNSLSFGRQYYSVHLN